MQLPRFGLAGIAPTAEDALVRRAAAGDAAAFAELYERHLDRVFRYFYYRLASREDAEDLAEQVFLKAWQAIKGYDCRGAPFAAWLFRIAHNLLADHHRARRSAGQTEELDEELEVEDPDAGPEEVVALQLEARELAEALGKLSEVEQSVIALRFVEGLDHRTVASAIGKSEVATRSIQSRALTRLARILRPSGVEGRSEP